MEIKKTINFSFSPEDFKKEIEDALRKVLSEFNDEKFDKQLYSINHVAKNILKISWSTLDKKIKEGLIRTTPDGKFIPGSEITKYLNEEISL